MVTAVSEQELTLDLEWVELIKEALDLGIPIEDIRAFLNQ
ncbi:anti-repressor SinI family protein [Mesobacillus maritimus]|uniref:Anti-repressor SinI family protein n=1 Tax=Mesobacillus maritimus TaxID=1643336 RepID=A0ABS7K4W6_9BACI|nr:anti-repressor SinI family protein [Mesobacillus maritimus]MBY0097299.1 anti-repressor SinI family protein [Mesobacillus maritimus]